VKSEDVPFSNPTHYEEWRNDQNLLNFDIQSLTQLRELSDFLHEGYFRNGVAHRLPQPDRKLNRQTSAAKPTSRRAGLQLLQYVEDTESHIA